MNVLSPSFNDIIDIQHNDLIYIYMYIYIHIHTHTHIYIYHIVRTLCFMS